MRLQDVWRSPGCYEVPDILGNAYLKPESPVAMKLRPLDPAKQVSKVMTEMVFAGIVPTYLPHILFHG